MVHIHCCHFKDRLTGWPNQQIWVNYCYIKSAQCSKTYIYLDSKWLKCVASYILLGGSKHKAPAQYECWSLEATCLWLIQLLNQGGHSKGTLFFSLLVFPWGNFKLLDSEILPRTNNHNNIFYNVTGVLSNAKRKLCWLDWVTQGMRSLQCWGSPETYWHHAGDMCRRNCWENRT